MFRKIDKKLDEIFLLAKILKEKFPNVKIKIKDRGEFYEIFSSFPIDKYQFEELKYLVFSKLGKKIKFIR